MLRRTIQLSKSGSLINSAIRPLVSSIAFFICPSTSSSSVTLADPTLHRGTLGDMPTAPFYRRFDFILQGLVQWDFSWMNETLDTDPGYLCVHHKKMQANWHQYIECTSMRIGMLKQDIGLKGI
uniref:Late blight resistance protein n=1 Tax=Solanum tuberosum TaxID=4113 RepID=M1DGL0_SOLTU